MSEAYGARCGAKFGDSMDDVRLVHPRTRGSHQTKGFTIARFVDYESVRMVLGLFLSSQETRASREARIRRHPLRHIVHCLVCLLNFRYAYGPWCGLALVRYQVILHCMRQFTKSQSAHGDFVNRKEPTCEATGGCDPHACFIWQRPDDARIRTFPNAEEKSLADF